LNLLLVAKLDRYARAINTITQYVRAGKDLGHNVSVFGEWRSEFSWLPHSLEIGAFDFAVFVIYETDDFPELPHLARLLDDIPRERRVIVDCCGRYNDTVQVEHDSNHFQKLDGHHGWEWIEGLRAVSDNILQPTLRPLRGDVRPFRFHGYDPTAVARSYSSAGEAASAWSGATNGVKPCGVAYLGSNWQRWTQMRRFLEAIEPIRDKLGTIRLAGWGWDQRPDWASELGVSGVDVDTTLLGRLRVETTPGVTFDNAISFMSQAHFSPIFHRPLFNYLCFVTNRTFETFCADTIPLLILPDQLIESIYGPEARLLAPHEDLAWKLDDIMRHPEMYWDVVLKTRRHLAQHHSYRKRFQELVTILES